MDMGAITQMLLHFKYRISKKEHEILKKIDAHDLYEITCQDDYEYLYKLSLKLDSKLDNFVNEGKLLSDEYGYWRNLDISLSAVLAKYNPELQIKF